MKKQFFYAAFAIAMMASCTNENDVLVEQPATPDDDRVAIELGVDAPSITASSRGTGSVGDVEGENNKWNSERLYIAMVDKDGNLATETDADGETVNILDWTNHEYRAPKNVNSETIRIYNTGTFDATTGYGTLQYKYYPVNGKYDFYGWHIDALNIADETTTEGVQVNVANGAATVNNITIDGTQDIMGARTIPFTEENTAKYNNAWTAELNDWAFSARTARATVKPVLKYEHQLARLKFYVRAGSDKTAINGESGANQTAEDTPRSTAMYVTALSVSDLANIIDMNLNDNGAISTAKNTAAVATEFKLGSKNENGLVEAGELEKVAPQYKYDKNTENTHGELIGESMMFFPCEIETADGTANSEESLKINLSLEQLVIDTETESVDGSTYEYATKTQDASVTVKASSIVGGNGTKKFEPGKSYNIYITIYGFERIEVTAELTAWEDGGDVDVDIEEGVSKDPEEEVSPTTTDVTVTVTGLEEGETADNITVTDAEGTTVAATDGKYTLAVGATYTVTVTKEGYTQSGETSFTIAEGQTTIEVTMTKNAEPEPDTQDVTFTVTPSVEGVVTLTVDGQILEVADSKYTVEDGKEVAWTVVVTEGEGEEQTTTTYSGTFTVSSESTEVTLTCDESSKQQN